MRKIIENFEIIKTGIVNDYISSKISTEASLLESPKITNVEHNLNNPSKIAEFAGYGVIRKYGNFKVNDYRIFCSYIGNYNYALYYDGTEEIKWEKDYSLNTITFLTDKDKLKYNLTLSIVDSFASPDGKDITQKIIYCLKNKSTLMDTKPFEVSIKELFQKIYMETKD